MQPVMRFKPCFFLTCLLPILLLLSAGLQADSRLVREAFQSDRASQSLLLDITTAGQRLVAVGERGHIIYRDPGQPWQQAQVPVIAHLTAVHFATAELGFAVGHEAIILRTTDAGVSWELVHHETEESPLLGIQFLSETTGFVVGGYNLLLMTEDGGDSWTFLGDELPNPEEYHNNAIIRDTANRLFIAGERGMLFRSIDQGASWEQLPLDYDGSLFGLFATPAGDLVATGLRGNLFISRDAGDSWQALDHDGEQTLNGGLALDDGRLLVVGQNGEYLLGHADQLQVFTLPGRNSLLAVARQGQDLIAVGRGGIHTLPLSETNHR
ncbi:WD40/YVTN/BNR-like repeat-containing protein [Marinospirillum alkaliphilum]|uniref:Photosynthesis system II assembly factor Ycf48/Hcf136-like domain-containing protein n=1 Tax=Marinospirillum alkaliphilum DSM 21637 TaxID=1122209 RepID=A0A1K1YHW0_9GAMM|nr:YCF48-related protein [Marinospirillum alkaliphilum]SFX60973.1 Uncharacterized protein SAMN02745752_02231 [Marinospirillum alkaliphilum DSM 21637]